MEQKNNLILQGTETFSRGALDNVALENGCLVLDSSAGRYLPYGSYTSPELAMPAFCNLNVSWNALAPDNTMLEVRCRVYAGGDWGGGVGIQLQVNLSSNDAKVTPAVRLLAAAVRPLAWERQDGAVINRRLYLPEYRLDGHDPSFGREMDLSLVVASLMNRWGEDILPEEVAYTMFDGATNGVHNAAYAVAAAACCGYPAWQGWLDLKELRAQIHDGCSVGVEMETRLAGQKEPVRVWMVRTAQRPHRRRRAGGPDHAGGRFPALFHRAGHHPAAQAPGHPHHPPPAHPLRAGGRRRGRMVLYPQGGAGPAARGFRRLDRLHPLRRGGPRHHRPWSRPGAGAASMP